LYQRTSVCISIELPNILYRGATANADNAFYYIAAMETAEQFLLTIYNRWGVSVFQTNDLSSRWDGNTPGGAPVAPGTYFAVLSYVDCQGNEGKVSGTVTVMD
jgi:gliding motility-associated-like protein